MYPWWPALKHYGKWRYVSMVTSSKALWEVEVGVHGNQLWSIVGSGGKFLKLPMEVGYYGNILQNVVGSCLVCYHDNKDKKFRQVEGYYHDNYLQNIKNLDKKHYEIWSLMVMVRVGTLLNLHQRTKDYLLYFAFCLWNLVDSIYQFKTST